MSADLVTVRTCYGDTFRVARADLEGPRVLLPIYCASGLKRSEHRARMNWANCGATLLHRGNIAEVIGPDEGRETINRAQPGAAR